MLAIENSEEPKKNNGIDSLERLSRPKGSIVSDGHYHLLQASVERERA